MFALRMMSILFFLSLASSCGFFGSSQEDTESTPDSVESADSEPALEEDLLAEEAKIADLESEGEGEDLVPEEVEESASIAESTPMEEKEERIVSSTPGLNSYQVKKGDTLMWIAFKVFGDYRKWRQLAKANNMSGQHKLRVGQTISYEAPANPFRWDPNGNPYLILRGDTLGKISKKVYGVNSRWKEIWYNNRPMIRNPNKIFAGFTLYYIPDQKLSGLF